MASKKFEEFLREARVRPRRRQHRETYTAPELAAHLHVSGRQLAKVVMAWADEELVMLVLPSTHKVDGRKLQALLGAKVGLAKEGEFKRVFDCIVGGMPPFGEPYGLRLFVDQSLTEVPKVVFRAGSLGEVMELPLDVYLRLAKPQKVGGFSVPIQPKKQKRKRRKKGFLRKLLDLLFG